MFGVIYLAIKMNVKEFPIILALTMLGFLGCIWIGILPSWVIIFPILFASAMLVMIVQKWLGSHSSASE